MDINFYYFLLCVLVNIPMNADCFSTHINKSAIRSYVNTVLACQNMTGLSVAVIKNGTVFADGFGVKNWKTMEPITNTTLMNIGSVTKSLSSLVMAMLISEAKTRNDTSIDWNMKLEKFLGTGFKLHDECMTRMVTLEDFMSHRTGLESADLMFESGIPDHVTRNELIRNLQYLSSRKKFRDRFYYSNIGYVMVGHIIETILKKSWEESMKEKLFRPLSMSSTTFMNEENFRDFATPYLTRKDKGIIESDERIYLTLTQFGPAGSIGSTSNDMAKILEFLTKDQNGGSIQKDVFRDLFKQKSIFPNSFRSRYSVLPPFPVIIHTYGYGLAWFLSKYRGYDMFFHTGGWYGFTSVLAFIPSKNVGVFLNANSRGNNGFKITMLPTLFYIFDILLDMKPWLNETTACTYPLPWKEPSDDSSKEDEISIVKVGNVERFLGQYDNPLYGNISVLVVKDTLTLTYGKLFRGILSYSSGNVFNLIVLEPLSDVLSKKQTAEFAVYANNKFNRVTFAKYYNFDRITTNSISSTVQNNIFVLCSATVLYKILCENR